MKKYFFIILVLLGMSSVCIYADMTSSNACKKRIRDLEAKVGSLNNRIEQDKACINRMSAEIEEQKKRQKDFNELWLIPNFLKVKKSASFDKKIEKLQKDIKERENWVVSSSNELAEAQRNIQIEKNKLHSPVQVICRQIQINAWGSWDALVYTEPEIRIQIGNRTFGTQQDKSDLSIDLYEDIGSLEYIYVFDQDPLEYERMGRIFLEKQKIVSGVDGDNDKHTITGTCGDNSKGFSYSVTYEVKY